MFSPTSVSPASTSPTDAVASPNASGFTPTSVGSTSPAFAPANASGFPQISTVHPRASQAPQEFEFPTTFMGEGAFDVHTHAMHRQAGQLAAPAAAPASQGRDLEGWTAELQLSLEKAAKKAKKLAALKKKAMDAQKEANKLKAVANTRKKNRSALHKLLGSMMFADVKHTTIDKKAPEGTPPKITFSPHAMPAFLNAGTSQGLTPKEVEAAKLIMQVNKLINDDPEFKKAILVANMAKPKAPKAPTV